MGILLTVFYSSLVVPFKPVSQVLGMANIIAPVLLASQNIHPITHSIRKNPSRGTGFVNGGDDEIRTRDLRRDRPAF